MEVREVESFAEHQQIFDTFCCDATVRTPPSNIMTARCWTHNNPIEFF